jgi:F-type H+-transporting ATPase subunit epsilon
MPDVNLINFEIVTPESVVLEETILQVSVPTSQGEITILPNHIPLVASLQPGVLEIVKADGEREVISTSGGFIEVLKNKVVILADTAERAEHIDVSRAEEARARAEKLKEDMKHFDREQFASITAQIAKELARTKAARRWKKIKNIE